MPILETEEGNYGELASRFLLLISGMGGLEGQEERIRRLEATFLFGAHEAGKLKEDVSSEDATELAYQSLHEGDQWIEGAVLSKTNLDIGAKIPFYVMSLQQNGQEVLAAIKHAKKIIANERREQDLKNGRTLMNDSWVHLRPFSPMLAALMICGESFAEALDQAEKRGIKLPSTVNRNFLKDGEFWDKAEQWQTEYTDLVREPLTEIVHTAREIQAFGENHHSTGQKDPMYAPGEVWEFPDWVPKSYKPLKLPRLSQEQIDWALQK